MWQFALKVALTTVIIVAVSEIAKRNSFWAATYFGMAWILGRLHINT